MPGGVSPTDPVVLRELGLQVAGAVLVTVLGVTRPVRRLTALDEKTCFQ